MPAEWWRDAVIYQVYLRSFADGNGDGVGDLRGLRDRLPYLRDLGVDALWLNPWYPSPMADGGYDIVDYRDIDPVFGTLADAQALIDDLHTRGIRLIIDLVPNHCSAEHRWFRAALATGPGSPERARFWFRPGRGPGGTLPPNDWQSYFGGSAWTRLADGDWYLHLFAAEQPDFNWDHPDVAAEFDDVLQFWLDRGVDGFRVDVAHALVKADGLPDAGDGPLPFQDQPGVHEIYRSWRRRVDAAGGDCVLVGEVWLPPPCDATDYIRADEMHSAFNFDYLCCPWDAPALRAVVRETIASHARVRAPPTWVLSNHDVPRHITRYGRSDTAHDPGDRRLGWPSDLELGERRARAAALLMFALPGCVYVYQGEELGLAEHLDIPAAARQDPIMRRSGGADLGRDGCRVPLPWCGAEPPFGFSTSEPWLVQPRHWAKRTVEAQDQDPTSMLELYRAAIARRPTFKGELEWCAEATRDVLHFARGPARCVVNLGRGSIALPAGEVILASEPIVSRALPADSAAWLVSG